MLGNEADADDATQEALIAIVRGLPAFDARARLSTWAYRIAVNAALDELRRRQRRARPEDMTLEAKDRAEVGSHDDPERIGDQMDVDAALGRISPEFRAAVVLRDLCGLDYAEIAEVLDIPPGTVRSRIARGRAALVPLLGNLSPSTHRPTPPVTPSR